MMESKRAPSIFKVLLISFIVAVVAINVYRVFFFELPTQAHERLNWFEASTEQEILLADLFPWSWDRLCHTREYATRNDFKRALGRPLTFRESWIWFLYGTGAACMAQVLKIQTISYS